MTLQKQFAVTGLLVALPLAYALTSLMGSIRTWDTATTLERVVKSQINDQVRERCESDPQWFLTGPLEGRPKPGDPKPADPDVFLPRPKVEERPFELFAYDETFIGSSTAAARFPQDIKNALRSGSRSKIVPFDTAEGQGVQMGILTSWSNGPCAVFLARLRPVPGRTGGQVNLFLAISASILGAVLIVGAPIARRLRRVSEAARDSSQREYTVTVPAPGHDEITAVGAAFNEACADIRRRIVDVKDREESHRRFVARVGDDLGPPVRALEARLGAFERQSGLSGANRDELRSAIKGTHDLASDLANLLAAAKLRMRIGLAEQDTVDLGGVITRIAKDHAALAHASDVSVEVVPPASPVAVIGDVMLFERVVANLVENAIRYNQPGGRVRVALASDGPDRFALQVSDNGAGVPDVQLSQLMAVRRFRGDEGQGGPGSRGLGLALVWEVAERCQWQVVMQHAMPHGLDVRITGRTAS